MDRLSESAMETASDEDRPRSVQVGSGKRKAAVFATRFVPYSQTFVYDEIRAHERYEVEVFCKERMNPEWFPYPHVHKPPRWAESFYEATTYWPGFNRELISTRYDLAHAHFGFGAIYALRYVRRHRLPFVVTFHGNDVSALIGSQRYNPHRWRYLLKSSRLFRCADRILGVSTELCSFLADLSGRPDAVKLYHSGVDLERYRPADTKPERPTPEVLLVGRFTEKKGHRYALEALASVVGAGRRVHLTFVGTGELEPLCRRLVKDRNLESHVTFAGVLSASKTAEAIRMADIAIVPSVVARNHDREGSPVFAKEASACGLPVIATWHAGLPDTIEDGITGFLVPERNVRALADRLITLLDDASLRRRFGLSGRAKMEREFELGAQVRKLEQHYDAVLR